MQFNLKQPCTDCPFKKSTSFSFPYTRAMEISGDDFFACHKTTTSIGRRANHPKSEHCAGKLIMLENEQAPSQSMRIAERLGLYDHTKLKTDPDVFSSRSEFMKERSY